MFQKYLRNKQVQKIILYLLICITIALVFSLFSPVYADDITKYESQINSIIRTIVSVIGVTVTAVGVALTAVAFFQLVTAFRSDNGEQAADAAKRLGVAIIIIAIPAILASIKLRGSISHDSSDKYEFAPLSYLGRQLYFAMLTHFYV